MVTWTLRKVKRLIIAVTGFTVLAIGIALIVLPGPAIVVLPIGLGILASEFVWAKTLLKHTKRHLARLRTRSSSAGKERSDA